VNARNRVFIILALLTLGSLIWYLVTVRPTGDLQLIGTVDANEVLVSARIPGRIQTLTVKEGDTVKAGQLIAVIGSDDLDAALKAAEAATASQRSKLNGTVETERQNSAGAGRRGFPGPGQSTARTSAGRYQPDRRARPAGHHERASAG
jgi:HlyD family secretion protein